MAVKLSPASSTLDASGTPFSPLYNDVYHSADSGPGQAQHVFIAGNGLPERWARMRVFTIVETGFGLGLNFLATWQAWRADPQHCERLHFVSIEKHPFEHEALTVLHARYPEFAQLATQLRSAWPQLVPGLHRLHFDDERVTLTLALGDVAEMLPQLYLGADAFYLDGFAPQRNSEMWTSRVMKALARLARGNATLATYTTARAVRDALIAAGFVVEKRTGFGRKHQMLAGHFAPRWKRKHVQPTRPGWPTRHAIVIGAGLAGSAVCERLAVRGWRVDLIERHPHPAAEASGMPSGIFRPHVSPDDCLLSQLTRAGFLYALNHWQTLITAGHQFAWQRCGALQIAGNHAEEIRMEQMLNVLGYPEGYAQYVSRATANAHAGCQVASGGWWFPAGGQLRPAELAAAQLAATPDLAAHFNTEVHTLVRDGKCWNAITLDGTVIATAPVVVLANAHDAARLAALGAPLWRVRGQLTLLAAETLPKLSAVVCGAGYVLPANDGPAIAGASYDLNGGERAPRASEHALNLERARQLLGGAVPETAVRGGSVGFRCVAPDRMPLIGALPDVDSAIIQAAVLTGAQLPDLPRLPGLYGAFGYASHGLIWAALGGELIASMIEDEPLPLQRKLADAVDPARFVLKRVRRGTL